MSYVLKKNNTEIAISLSWNPKLFGNKTMTSYPAIVSKSYVWEQDGYWLGWVEDVIPEPIPETPEQTISRLEGFLDNHLDSVANSYRYSSILTMVGYRDDPNPKFNAEGWAAFNWRSAVYTIGIQLITDVMSGTTPIPTEEELLALIPPITDYLVYPQV